MRTALRKAGPVAAGMLIVSIAKLSPLAITFLALIIVMSLLAVIVIFGMMCRTAPQPTSLRQPARHPARHQRQA